MEFDENGFPIQKARSQSVEATRSTLEAPQLLSARQEDIRFRFMDLPPEIRNRVYELVSQREAQPVCITDDLLRPSDSLDLDKIRRECTFSHTCHPCQVNLAIGTGHGISRASQQLHMEMALTPYGVNTFSAHNLYYLHAFLKIIGKQGRRRLKSLEFLWRFFFYDSESYEI